MSENLANEILTGSNFILEVDITTGTAYKIDGKLISDLTQQEIDSYSYKLNPDIVREYVKYKEDRVKDGQQEYLLMTSYLRLNAITNNIPRSVNREIELAFLQVMDAVWKGQWISAKEFCEDVVVTTNVTQSLKDQILNIINNYISANY